jgi:hypothetical protein
VLVALPLLAAARAIWMFFSERLELERWPPGAEVAVPVEVEVDVQEVDAPTEPIRPLAD